MKKAPTIGRTVLYNDGISDQMTPAIVCYVWHDSKVNLGGFGSGGTAVDRTSVPFHHGEGDIPPFHAGWMPYQKQKHDEEAKSD